MQTNNNPGLIQGCKIERVKKVSLAKLTKDHKVSSGRSPPTFHQACWPQKPGRGKKGERKKKEEKMGSLPTFDQATKAGGRLLQRKKEEVLKLRKKAKKKY